MSEQLLSTAIEVFCHRLEEDGVDDVSLELVRDRWIPEVIVLEAKLEPMERLANEFAVHRSYCSTQSNSPGQRQLPLECDCGYEAALHLAATQKE